VTKEEFIIYADESEGQGKYYSNFFGGVLVASPELRHVIEALTEAKRRQNLFREIKWTRVTSLYLEKYIAVIDAFFDQVEQRRLKVRLMFTHNRYKPQGLTTNQREEKYFLLYYQFLKNAFGLQYIREREMPIRCRVYLDMLPDTKEKAAQFKGFLAALSKAASLRDKVFFDANQIAEVDSRKHVILQCLDVVLGAIHFRLNDKHKVKPKGKRTRAKRTIAKDKLYRHINKRIRRLYPHFNVGITTGGSPEDRWRHPYRHWLFKPKNRAVVKGYTKKTKPRHRY
jgi:hypothetical protein